MHISSLSLNGHGVDTWADTSSFVTVFPNFESTVVINGVTSEETATILVQLTRGSTAIAITHTAGELFSTYTSVNLVQGTNVFKLKVTFSGGSKSHKIIITRCKSRIITTTQLSLSL